MNKYTFKCLNCGNEFSVVYSPFFEGKCSNCKSGDLILITKQNIETNELLEKS